MKNTLSLIWFVFVTNFLVEVLKRGLELIFA